MPVARLHLPFAGMPCWSTPLDLGVIVGVGGQVITFEKEKDRNRSGPAHILIIRVVNVFSCNNARSLSPAGSY